MSYTMNSTTAARMRHAPQTLEQLREAARDMLRRGFSDRDIADILQLDVDLIRRLVGDGCASGD